MCLWLERGAHFCKNTKTKCMRAQISSKSHLTNYIFDAYSYQDPPLIVFLHFARRVPSEMKITKSRLMVGMERPGGMRKAAGGDFEGVWELLLSIWHASACLRQGRRIQSLRAFRRAGDYEKPHFVKNTCFTLNWTLSPLCGTRRGIIERPLSLGVVVTSLVFSRHDIKNVIWIKPCL